VTPTKGIATLIAAMKIVWARDPGVRLLIAGAGSASSSETDSVPAMLEALSRDERRRVVSVGRFDEKEKASIFDAIDVFAMPSVAESFGIAYLEAWMCRKPVIGARIPSTTCVIDEGVDGMLVQPGDSDALARSILALLSNRALRERMGDAGHAKTVERFTWRQIADRLEHIYEQASAGVRVPAMDGAPADGTFARK
jgi:glycosyltransferase involved in cell wall biosynthesis